MRVASCLNLCLFASLILYLSAEADPRQWGTQGVPLRQGTYLNWSGTHAQDETGLTLLAWSDTRTHNRDIYAQLISPGGDALWDSGGIAVVQEFLAQRDPVACATNGGWIVAWIDQRDTSRATIWAQKLNSAGNRMWAAEGREVDMGEPYLIDTWSKLFVGDDGVGGALIIWQGYRSGGPMSIYLQRIDAEGASVWPEPLEIADPSGQDLSAPVSAADGMGNLFAEFATGMNDTVVFRCVKIMSDGLTPWGTLGVVLDSVVFYGEEYVEGEICADGSGGCYAEWNGGVQHVAANGQMAWPAPLEFANAYFRTLAALDSAGQPDGCAIITSSSYYYTEQDLFAQKFSADGQALWGENGIAFFSGLAYDPVVASDLAGGAVIAWRGEDASGHGISAIRLNAQGINVWSGPYLKAISPSADDARLSVSSNSAQCGLFYMSGSGANEFTVAFPQLAHQQLDMASGQPQFSDSGRVLADGIGGWADVMAAIEMSGERLAVAWTDSRENNNIRPLYFQIFDSTGQAQLAENGEPLLPAVDTAAYITRVDLVTDGAGGFFCLCDDYQNGAWQLRLTRRDAAGVQIGGAHGGLVSVEGYDPSYGYLCPDDSGGVYAAWTSHVVWGQNRKYVMRMGADCQPMWAEPLLIIAPYDPQNSLSVSGLVKTFDGGCVVLSQTRVSKVLNGAVVWGQVILNGSANVKLTPDSAGGVFVMWNTANGQTPQLQHYDAAGASWDSAIPFDLEGWRSYANSLIPAPQNGVYAVWHRQATGQEDRVTAHHVTASREILWPDSGILICTQPSASPRCIASGGNLFAVWEDVNSENADAPGVLRGRLIGPDGSIPDVWWQPTQGGLICDSAHRYTYGRVAPIGTHYAGVVFTPWSDDAAMGGDLRAQWLNLEITTKAHDPSAVPRDYALYQNYPNPFNPVTEIAFGLPQAGNVTLAVYDLLGREVRVLADEPMSAGKHRIIFDAASLPSGIYFYRLQAGTFTESRKLIVLK